MRAHFLQHVPFEGLGSIEQWLTSTGYRISCTRLFAGETLPDISDLDFLIIMGGPMSVNDEAEHPWLIEEKAFIKTAINSKIPTLGICLGAQLIANTLGGTVFPNQEKEIGWFPIQATQNNVDPEHFGFPEEITVFHWHGETFNLPEQATRIASSQACQNQAFQIGKHVIGLQFHLETTPQSAQDISTHCADELVEGKYIQSAEEILAAPKERYDAINTLMTDILFYLHNNRH